MSLSLPQEGLKREISAKAIAANAINAAIGAGIFILPARVSETLGPSGILAYALCGLLIFMVMLCFAEVGSRVTRSGGAYAYVENAFGPYLGFITSNLYWFGFGLISDAAIINAMAEMLTTVFPWFGLFWVKCIFFALTFTVLGYVNVLGVKHGSRLVEFITFIKLLPLLLLIMVGWTTVVPENLTWTTWPSLFDLGQASLLLFFAFGGAESALTVSGEIKNPQRSVPLGILWGIGIVVLIYMAIHLITQGILGPNLTLFKEAPLAEASKEVFGPAGTVLILVCSAMCIWGALSGDVLTMPRFLFAGARDRLFPSFLSKIHPRFSTPYWAIIVYAALGFVFSMSGGFRELAILSSSAILITYLAVIMSAIKMRIDQKTLSNNGFKIPGGYFVHFVAMSTIIWFLTHLTSGELTAIVLALVAFSLIYMVGRLVGAKVAVKNEF